MVLLTVEKLLPERFPGLPLARFHSRMGRR